MSATGKWIYRNFVILPYRNIRKYVSVLAPFKTPSNKKLMASDSVPDYIIWGVIDWHFRYQRPQQLAKMIAATGRRVFYISSNFRSDMRSGFDLEALDSSGRLFQVKLFVKKPPIIYFSAPSSGVIDQLRLGLGHLLGWASTKRAVSIVQHSFWYDIARVIPNSWLVYDCIDHHEGFGNNSNGVVKLEHQLLRGADLVVTTSEWLNQFASKYAKRRMLIRNACDYAHFSREPKSVYEDLNGRRIIGYFGAIARWLDLELVQAVASRFPECCVLLIGADTVRAQQKLGHLKNVKFVGEVAYGDLPYYLYSFDVAILPFKVNQLTLATNPVKVYEYLAAGKPVVSVSLPELSAFDNLVHSADSVPGFVEAIAKVLYGQDACADVSVRQEFASKQTWYHRAQALIKGIEGSRVTPVVSIVVVTYNNLELTRECLLSIDLFSDSSNLEIIVVDNASSDGSTEFLKQWALESSARKLILNKCNRGFAAACNQGLAVASGEYLVLLNNDTYVTPGWIGALYHHLKNDSAIGLIGPVTNGISNEARIDINYSSMEQMLRESGKYKLKHLGVVFKIRTLAFYCVMMPRHVYSLVGPLDESFGLGFFEDDDYCRRVERAGFTIVCAEDAFVHHHLSASFLRLDRDVRRSTFSENKAKYEARWGPWEPHAARKRTLRSIFRHH